MSKHREAVIAVSKNIDFDQIPGIEWRALSDRIMTLVKAYFEDPVHKQEFEEWKKNRK